MAASLGVGAPRSLPAIPSHSPNPLRFSTCIKLHTSFSSSPLSLNQRLSISNFNFQLNSAVEQATVEEIQQQINQDEKKRKLFVVNLPWGFSIEDVKKLFGECGTVKDVEIIKAKDGRHKGFSFITMGSPEEAQAVVQKFDSYELSGRIIRVEFAKRLKKPPPPPADTPVVETRHKLYVSNLAWKARSTHLREFFSAEFNPVSARVVFDRPSGGSAGYGFVSFPTHEEAEAAISSMDGKELMGRAIRLKFSEKNVDGSERETKDNTTPDGQSKETDDMLSKNEES